MFRWSRILLASLSAVWAVMVLACGGGGNQTQPPQPPTAAAVAQPAEEPTTPVPPPPKRPGVGDAVTLTDKSGKVPVAKDHAALVEWQQAEDDFARRVAQVKGITSVASGTEATILSESGGTFTVKITNGIYAEATGVIAADSALEEYNQKVKERDAVLAQIAAQAKERHDRLAKAKAEQERLAAEKAAAREEAKRQADELARKKAEEEYEVGGLVLLRKTVSGTRDHLTGSITGTVVNRTGRTVGYAQITFDLYDASEGRVGTAWANINNLGPGERWNFKAVAFTDFHTYKLQKLTGF